MKKLLLLTLLLSPLFVGFSHAKQPLLDEKLARTVARAQARLPIWQQQLLILQKQFKRAGSKIVRELPFSPANADGLSGQDQQIYSQRLRQTQQKLRQHPLLKDYTFAAPVPEDLAHLADDNYAALHAFLENAPVARVVCSECVLPFTLSLEIKGISAGRLEIWIDEPTKKIYLMSNNFYTTAAGKYNLH